MGWHRLQVDRPRLVVEIQHGEIWLMLLEVADTRLAIEILRADFQVDGSEQSNRHPPLSLPGSFFLSTTMCG